MGQEIRKETDWLGREKEVTYEDNVKVGETRQETTFWGTPVDRTYDVDKNRVSETRHEHTFWGTPVDRTYDNNGERVSETRHEHTFWGTPVDRTYDNDGDLSYETRRESTIWGTPVKRVYETGTKSGASRENSDGYSSAGDSVSSSRETPAVRKSSSVAGKRWSKGWLGVFIILAAALIIRLVSASNSNGKMSSVVPPTNEVAREITLPCGENDDDYIQLPTVRNLILVLSPTGKNCWTLWLKPPANAWNIAAALDGNLKRQVVYGERDIQEPKDDGPLYNWFEPKLFNGVRYLNPSKKTVRITLTVTYRN